jgi:hypothetical protein
MGRGSEWENCLIKDHVSGNHKAVCREVKTAITFVMFGIPKKDTTGGASCKFVWCCGGHVRVASAAKDTEMLISWGCTEQGVIRARHADGLGGGDDSASTSLCGDPQPSSELVKKLGKTESE